MDDKLKFAAVLMGGYLLGRTKRLKMALAVAAALGVRELRANPDLLKAGTSVLSTPAVKRLTDELSGRLVEAGKTAVVAAASKRVDSLVSSLEERAAAPGSSGSAQKHGSSRPSEPEEPAEDEPEVEPEEEQTPSEEEEPADEESRDEEREQEDDEQKATPRTRRTASGSSSRSSSQSQSKRGASGAGTKKSTGTRSTRRSTGGASTRKSGSR